MYVAGIQRRDPRREPPMRKGPGPLLQGHSLLILMPFSPLNGSAWVYDWTDGVEMRIYDGRHQELVV